MLAMGRGLMLRGRPAFTWVLDEFVVGDNIAVWVSPTIVGPRSRQCFEGCPARMLASMRVAGADRETTRDVASLPLRCSFTSL